MKKLIFISAVFLFASCNEAIELKDSKSIKKNIEKTEEKISYENPRIIGGASFGIFFQTLYKLGDFNKMLAFTSSESVEKHGKKRVMEFYKTELDFGYNIEKGAISEKIEGDTVTLSYNANIMATNKVIRVNVVIENDSAKIVLPDNLRDFPS